MAKASMTEADVWASVSQYVDAEIEQLKWQLDLDGTAGFEAFDLEEDVTLITQDAKVDTYPFIAIDGAALKKGGTKADSPLWELRILGSTASREAVEDGTAKRSGFDIKALEKGRRDVSGLTLFWVQIPGEDGRDILLKELVLSMIVARGGDLPKAVEDARDYLIEAERRRHLPKQDVGTLHRQNDPTSKVANAMTDPQLFEAIVALDVAGKAEKKKGQVVETAVSFSWEGDIQLHRPISQWDREVHGGVSSLWAEGQRYVSDAQIARATGIKNPTKNQVARVVESVELQRWVKAFVDFSQEARGRVLTFEGEPVTTLTLDGPLISADRVEMKSANGTLVSGYVLNRAPLMYMHAAIMGQVTNYPQRLLELGEGRDTERNVLLRRELLRRVYRIRHKWTTARTQKARDEVQRNIRLVPDKANPARVSLFEYAGVPLNDRDARKRSIEYVTSILDGVAAPRSMDEEHGDIADYKLVTEKGRGGTKVVAIEIIL